MIEPTRNTYVLTVRLEDVKKADARKLAAALQTIAEHEGIASDVSVSHVKFDSY